MDEMAATDAFSVLGNDIRVGILRELADAMGESPDSRLSFSTLRERVGVRDPGKFNYHLDRLRGTFVEKTDDGYVLRYPGLMVVSAIRAGTYTGGDDTETVETDRDCPRCGDGLTVTYGDGFLELSCDEDDLLSRVLLPPGATEGRTTEELLELANRSARRDMSHAADGVCPYCWGQVDATIRWPEATSRFEDTSAPGPKVRYDCGRCWANVEVPLAGVATLHPAVVAFYHDHGVNVHDWPFVGLSYSGTEQSIVSEDPVRVSVTLREDDEEMRVVLDDEGTVVDTKRD
ncbi:DUF7351 domain-containing protein [Halomicrococcus gelatinilyticus]|uniref:DUF7351 domain-containing protein n=1 Tax=Halomicrococcus gelatinilyticus TaxID=1702103 RepID=UPI002E0D8BB4